MCELTMRETGCAFAEAFVALKADLETTTRVHAGNERVREACGSDPLVVVRNQLESERCD